MTVKRIYRRPVQRSQTVLSQAEAYWDLRYYDGGTSLRDMHGRHPAVLGSSAGSDSNDPLYLPYAGTPYLYLPGVAGNYASVPDAAALDITGDIDIRVKVAMVDWTPAAVSQLIAKRPGGSNISYTLFVDTSGKFVLYTTPDGATAKTWTSSVATGIADGAAKWVRATLDVDNGAGDAVATFYTSDNGTSWTQLGTTILLGATTSIYAGTADLEIGSSNLGTASNVNGMYYAVQIYNGIAGTKVLDIDFTALASYNAARTSLTAVTGQTVTISRSATGRKAAVVERNVMLMGVDDYLEVADDDRLDFSLTDSFTVVAVARFYGSASITVMAKKADHTTGVGYGLTRSATPIPAFRIADGTTAVAVGGSDPAGSLVLMAGVRKVYSVSTIDLYLNGSTAGPTTDTTAGTLANNLPLRIGATSVGAPFADMEFFGAALFRRALSDSEIKRLQFEFSV